MLLLILQHQLLIFLRLINYPMMDVSQLKNYQRNHFFFVLLARDDPQSLVILLHEEIVVIDLLTDSWPSYRLPYLNSIHASPVICTTLTCNVNPQFYKKLLNYATIQFDDYSDRVC